uniref:MYND-type domain-containing protein n=1 Tax=Anopheles atroparvus TaxID=41427 RepID=A0A182ISW3_ANOAO
MPLFVPSYNNFNPNRCNNCFNVNTNKPCTATKVVCKCCRLIKYCSFKHQTIDMNLHKEFCDAVVKIMKATNATHILDCAATILQEGVAGERGGKHELRRKIDCSMYLLEKVLERPLQYHERVLLQHPEVCKVCHAVGPNKLQFCNECHQIGYCSKDHQEQDRPNHSKWCQGYRQNFILNDHEPLLPFLYGILKYSEADRQSLPHDIYQLASRTLYREIRMPTPDGPAMEQQEEIDNLKIASIFSWVGTILYTLSTTNVLDELRDQLNVYLVGASKETSFLNMATCASLFSCIPKLRTIRLFLIGPNTCTNRTISFAYNNGQQVELIHYRHLYHQLPNSCTLDHPQLIVAFNCGFTEIRVPTKNTWLPTIRSLLQFHSVPFAFTSYTHKEAIDDCTTVLSEALELYESNEKLTYVKRAAVNPFRDPRPYRNPDILDEKDELYHDNGYLSIVIGKKYS